MKILIVNIAWIDNGWTGSDNQTTSGHRHVQEGGTAHESLNFKFDGEWNSNENIYGFCQFTNPPKIEGNNNIVVFYSKNKIVGIYMNVEYGNYQPNNIPSDIGHFNLKASRINSFKLNKYMQFNPDKYLPSEKKKIGQIGFTYIEQEQLLSILNDMLEVNLELYDEIEDIKNYLGIKQNIKWDDFIKTIDFEKIEKIQKQVKDENLEEGLRVFSFLKQFRGRLRETITILKRYKTGQNQSPTQQYWTKGNGFRIGYFLGNKYEPSTQLNITLCASWGGGVFIKDKENLIFGNHKILELLKNKYNGFDFNVEKKHIGAIWFKNSIDSFPSEKSVLIAIKKLSEIFEIIIRAKKMEEKTKLLEYQKQIILQGPPGTGKTRLAKQMARYIIKGETEANIDDITEQVKLIQFHPSYSYEDFVRGIIATTTDDGKGVKYETQNKVLAQIAEEAKKSLGGKYYQEETTKEEKEKILQNSKKFILIIDEINRANLSSVLGELIYALEYRDEAVESMYEIEGNKKIILPSNLYIIGTMNTADRSIGHIDYAIRRRFAFETILPDATIVNTNSKFKEVEAFFKDDNRDDKRADTLSPEFNPDDLMLGHSYFIAEDIVELNNKLEYQVKPLLIEYIKDGILVDTDVLRKSIEKL